MLEKIESAAPLLARHASAYGELLADDLLTAWEAFGRRLFIGVALVMAVLMTLLLASAWLIALTWDTPARLGAIGALAGLFLLVSLVTGYRLYVLQRKPMRLLNLTRHELDKDRRFVEELLPKTADEPS